MQLNASPLNAVELNGYYSPVFLSAELVASALVTALLLQRVQMSSALAAGAQVQGDVHLGKPLGSSLAGTALVSAGVFKEVNPSASLFGTILVYAPLQVLRYAEYLGNQRSAFVPTEETVAVVPNDLWVATVDFETRDAFIPGALEQVKV